MKRRKDITGSSAVTDIGLEREEEEKKKEKKKRKIKSLQHGVFVFGCPTKY